jgi:hypothetical protein
VTQQADTPPEAPLVEVPAPAAEADAGQNAETLSSNVAKLGAIVAVLRKLYPLSSFEKSRVHRCE